MITTVEKIQQASRRLFSSDLEYFFEQFLYGNREILVNYIRSEIPDFSSASYLKAGLSHGWAPDEQLWRLRNRNLSRAPRFVWNQRNELPHIRNSGAIAIGSSWIYLLKTLGINPGVRVENTNSNKSRPNLLMLTHNIVISEKSLELQAEFYKKIVDPTKTTVCLFWLDFCKPEVYLAYKSLGFEVVCAGYPAKFELGYQIYKGRPQFLANILRILSTHQSLITDECTTSTFYAASLGLEIQVIADPIALEFQSSWESQYGGDGREYFNSGIAWLRHFFPSLIDGKYDSIELNLLAWNELGWGQLLSPDEMSHLPWKIHSGIKDSPLEATQSAIENLRRELRTYPIR